MKKTLDLAIGDFSFTAHRLNLGESEEIAEFQETLVSGTVAQKLAAARAIILVAARRDQPDLTDADMKKIEATPRELFQAVNEFMKLNGYERENAKGEDRAADQEAAA